VSPDVYGREALFVECPTLEDLGRTFDSKYPGRVDAPLFGTGGGLRVEALLFAPPGLTALKVLSLKLIPLLDNGLSPIIPSAVESELLEALRSDGGEELLDLLLAPATIRFVVTLAGSVGGPAGCALSAAAAAVAAEDEEAVRFARKA
jgi:hypothetical protein